MTKTTMTTTLRDVLLRIEQLFQDINGADDITNDLSYLLTEINEFVPEERHAICPKQYDVVNV
jgi:hypothetical protein